jgi:DNA invertase Pin-like site-specific DNA recombinase
MKQTESKESKYVAYYRVSTKKQGESGLGLEAQRIAVLNYIQKNGNKIIAEFTEVESGKNDFRPELLKAISLAKENDAKLVIAKLDRLSRNVTFISQLMDSQVKFICCDMPEANELTIYIFAAIAQHERKRIRERIKEALDAKRVREPEWRPGKANMTREIQEQAWEAHRMQARLNQANRHAYHYIKSLKDEGLSYRKIADRLNTENYRTSRGNKFSAQQVFIIYRRFNETNQN